MFKSIPAASKCIATALVLIPLLSACVDDNVGSQPDAAPPSTPTLTTSDLDQVLERSVTDAVIPTVENFASEAKALDDAADSFCQSQTESELTALQQQWRDLFEQWYRLAIYNFGPLDDDILSPPYTFIDSLRLRGTNYTETVRNEISNDLASSTTLDDNYFARKTFQRVGLLALESVIFETASSEHSQTAAAIIAEYQNQPRKCLILQGLSAQVLDRANRVKDGWLVAFKRNQDPYRDLFLRGELDDDTKPLNQLILSNQNYLEYLQSRNVATTAAQISNHIWQALAASIDAIELLLQGREGATISIFSAMQASGNQNAIDSVRESIAGIRSAIEDRDSDMLEIRLGNLDGNFKREIPDSLDVELGINFSDGD